MFLEDIFLGLDIQEFLFYQVLRVDPSSSLVTGDIMHDLIFVLVIPALVGLIVLRGIMGVVLAQHGHLRTLFSIAALGTIIYMGLFTFLAQFSIFIFFTWLFIYGASAGYRMLVGERLRGWIGRRATGTGSWIGHRIEHAVTSAAGFDQRREMQLEVYISEAVSSQAARLENEDLARGARNTGDRAAAEDYQRAAREASGRVDTAISQIIAMRAGLLGNPNALQQMQGAVTRIFGQQVGSLDPTVQPRVRSLRGRMGP